MKKQTSKILGLLFLSLFIITTGFQNPNLIANNPEKQENIDLNKDNGSITTDLQTDPKAAVVDVINFTVNGTELFQDGIYYCFLGDTLSYKLTTVDAVDNVTFVMQKPGYDFAPITLTTPTSTEGSYKIWETTQYIDTDKKTGMYNGSIIMSMSGSISNFYYNLSVMNPQPRVLRAEMIDLKYGDGESHKIFESEEYYIYHFSRINITAWVVNDNGLENISSVKLFYENGYQDIWQSVSMEKIGSPSTIGGRSAQLYALSTPIEISMDDSSLSSMANWTTGNAFEFYILVSDKGDIEGDNVEQYEFKWNYVIANQPPEITEFNIEWDSHTDTDYKSATALNFTIYANISDPETDAMFGMNRYNFTETYKPSYIHNLTETLVLQNSNCEYSVDNIAERDALYHNLTFNSEDAYGFNFTFGFDHDFNDADLYKEWYFRFTFNTIGKTTVPNLQFQLYNTQTETWDLIYSFTSLPLDQELTYKLTNVNSSLDDTSIGDYVGQFSDGRKFQARLYAQTGSSGDISIDKIEMGFKVNRRVGGSDLILEIYRPTEENPEKINMIDLYDMDWDATGNRWACNYTYYINGSLNFEAIGAWSFILKAYDYGTTGAEDIYPIEQGGINQLSQFAGFSESDKTRSYAVDSKVIHVGMAENEIIKLSQAAMTETEPDDSQNTTVVVTLNDPDATNTFTYINKSYFPEGDLVMVQDGDSWAGYTALTIPPDPHKQHVDRVQNSALELNLSSTSNDKSSPLNMQEIDNVSYRFSINKLDDVSDAGILFPKGYINESFGIILGFRIDWDYWQNPINISGISFETKITVNDSTNLQNKFTTNTVVQAWDFVNQEWIQPMHEYGQSIRWEDHSTISYNRTLIKFDDVPTRNYVWRSTEWNNTQEIMNCISRDGERIIYLRIFENDLAGDPLTDANQENYNISIDYAKLTVEIKNDYQANLTLWDSTSNNMVTYSMKQAANTATTRTWQLEIPTSLLSGRNYHFTIWAQNGNSSIWYDRGQIQGIKFWTSNKYLWNPYYNSSISVNSSFTFRGLPGNIKYDDLQYNDLLNYHRHMEPLMFNGTCDYRYPLDDVEFYVQFRHWRMGPERSDWFEFPARNVDNQENAILEFDNQTSPQEWNLTLVFTHSYEGYEWRSGVWYYRVIIRTNETTVNATDWGIFRLHNFQPKNIILTGLENGSYYRVRDTVDYGISFVDIEGNNIASLSNWNASNYYQIMVAFNIQNRDENLRWERWDSGTVPRYTWKNATEYRYGFDGYIRFDRKIQIGTYDEIFITIKDFDTDWPQVGTLKITNREFTILDCPPIVSSWLDSNATGELDNVAPNTDQIYRENDLELNVAIFDYDDFGYNISVQYFDLVALNNTGDVVHLDESGSLIRVNDYANTSGLGWISEWRYNRYITRRNATGLWNFTCNFIDPDGYNLTHAVDITIEVLNNLPQLDNLKFERYNEFNTLIETAYLTSHFSNLTNFGVYRGNETLKVIADVHDVEDTWLPETDYHIKEVIFSLVNNYGDHAGEEYTADDYTFTLIRNGTADTGYTLSYESFDAKSFNTIQTDIISNTVLKVLNNDGTDATLDALQSVDSQYHNITFIGSQIAEQQYGGEYLINFTNVPSLFELHTKRFEFNLSFTYRTNYKNTDPDEFDGFEVYIWNYSSNEWVKLTGVLKSSSWTTTNFTIDSDYIRDFLTESSGNMLRVRITAKRFYPSIGREVELDIDQAYLSFFKIEDGHYERWIATYTFPIDTRPGDLTFKLRMSDKDNGIGIDDSNILNIYNVKPQFSEQGVWIKVNGEPLNKSEVTIQYSRLTPPIIEIYVSGYDIDSPNQDLYMVVIKAYIEITGNPDYTTTQGTHIWEFYAKDVILYEQNHTYLMKFSLQGTNTKSDDKDTIYLGEITSFELQEVTIVDKDVGYCDPQKFPTSNTDNTLVDNNPDHKYKITFLTEIGSGGGINMIIIIVIGAVAAAVGIFFFYRKYISYRKYLDDTY